MPPSTPPNNSPATSWTLLRQALEEAGELRQSAQAALVRRYQGFVRRVLGAVLRSDPRSADLLDELEQEFWVRLVRGDYRNVLQRQPGPGQDHGPSFRPYITTVLRHLVHSHWRVLNHCKPTAEFGDAEPADPALPVAEQLIDQERRSRYRAALEAVRLEFTMGAEARAEEGEPDYVALYRDHVLSQAMEELRRQDERSGNQFHAVLEQKRQHPELTEDDLARVLSRPGQARTTNWVRTHRHRARQQLGKLLRRWVEADLSPSAGSMSLPTRQDVDEELNALGLGRFRVNQG